MLLEVKQWVGTVKFREKTDIAALFNCSCLLIGGTSCCCQCHCVLPLLASFKSTAFWIRLNYTRVYFETGLTVLGSIWDWVSFLNKINVCMSGSDRLSSFKMLIFMHTTIQSGEKITLRAMLTVTVLLKQWARPFTSTKETDFYSRQAIIRDRQTALLLFAAIICSCSFLLLIKNNTLSLMFYTQTFWMHHYYCILLYW